MADLSTVTGIGDMRSLVISACKNVNLSFLSTDLWALTTLIMYAAKGRIEGLRIWALGLGMIIGIFVHMLFYLLIAITASYQWSIIMALILLIVGIIGVLLIRITVFERIEIPEMEKLRK